MAPSEGVKLLMFFGKEKAKDGQNAGYRTWCSLTVMIKGRSEEEEAGMEILLDNGERLTFAWRQSGGLTVQKWHAGQAMEKPWVLAGTSTVEGEPLINFLQSLVLPLLRRALHQAVQWPDKWKGTKS